jgi:tetratricopeptide (TPR) repeat protein
VNDVPPAVHRTIACVDVEGFGDRRRTNLHQVAVREALYKSLRAAFDRSRVFWEACYHEDRGDGALILVPPEVPKNLLVARVPLELVSELANYNNTHDVEARIRLRMVVHAGEVVHDQHGVAGTALNTAFRLLESHDLKQALRRSSGILAVIASEWFFDEVIRNDPASAPASYWPVRIAVKETRTRAWIRLPDDPYLPHEQTARSLASPGAVPRQLPMATAGFAGRETELDLLTEMLEERIGVGGTVVISAVDGTAGIGKTAIAVHWAHRVTNRFPDGQLYVNLRGFDPAGPPMAPGEAVRGFLDAFEISSERFPVSLEGQAALYRSLLAGRQVLVLLDNAHDSDQVRPLLPGSAGCMVLVTSRNRLTGLITAEGARPLTLDLLSVAEARQLLTSRVGSERITAEPRAVEEVVSLCARLPLALSIVAARAASHPTFSMATLAEELHDSLGGLEAFTDGDLAADLRGVFSWSYQRLSINAQRLFRLLGLHAGPAIDVHAAASLAAAPLQQARNLLAELAGAHLVEEQTPGRFSFHDLLRAYATELVYTDESDNEQRLAVRRVLDHYLHAVQAATKFLYPRMDSAIAIQSQPGVLEQEFDDPETAWAWLEVEYPVLVAAIRLATDRACDDYAWQLPAALEEYFDKRGHRYDCVAAHQAALVAAERGEDRYGQAYAHYGLGRASHWLGHFEEAQTHLEHALTLFEGLNEKGHAALAHIDLSHILDHQNRVPDALRHARRALSLSRATDNQRAQARALEFVGWYYSHLGNYQKALTYLQRAVALSRQVGDRRIEGYILNGLGYAHHGLGQYEQAIEYFQQELASRSELVDRYSQAVTFTYLGDSYHAAGHDDAARQAWRRALDMLENFGDPDVGHVHPEQLRARLRDLGDDVPRMHLE